MPTFRSETVDLSASMYVAEVRDFLASRGLPHGTPEALVALLQALREPAFREEMTSIVRSIFYRESEGLTPRGLADILIRAAMDDASAADREFPETQQGVLQFVASALHQRADDESEETGSDHLLPATALHSRDGSPEQPPTRRELLPAESPVFASGTTASPLQSLDDEAPSSAGDLHTNDRLSAAITHLVYTEEAPQQQTPRFQPQRETDHALRSKRQPGVRAGLRAAYWLPGVAVLLAVSGAVVVLNRHPAPTQPSPGQQISSVPRSGQPAAPPRASAGGATASTLEGTRSVAASTASGSQRTRAISEEQEPAGALPGAVPLAVGHLPSKRVAPNRVHTLHNNLPAHRSDSAGAEPREAVFLSSSGVMASHLTYAPAPNYPALARLTRLEGEVIAQVVVSRQGTVSATHVLNGPYLLRGSVEHAIRHWRYRPYVLDGRPTDVTTIVTVNFRLKH